MIFLTTKIKRDILHYLKTHNGAYFGDIVQHLDYSANKLMKTIIALKQKGKVFKDNNGGQYKLTK